MDNLLLYLLKVSTGTIFLYLCYLLFFSTDTFYFRNRIFLLMNLLLPIIIPFLKISDFPVTVQAVEPTNAMNAIILSGTSIGVAVSDKITSIDYKNFFIWLYFSVAGLILLRVAISLTRTYTIIRKGVKKESQFPWIIISDLQHPPFSFFPYVVIPRKVHNSKDYTEILNHEKTHISQGHTFDLLLSELLIAFQWFNPFIWLVRRSVVLNHEYLADIVSLRNAESIKKYQYKLLNVPTDLRNVPLAHNFSSLIKNRIVMINKKPTRNFAALKNILILPVVAVLIAMFSFRQEPGFVQDEFQEPLLSETSQKEILRFLANNITYPQEAKASGDTGSVFVVLRMGKGGIINDAKAFTDKKGITVPIIKEIVILGYKMNSESGVTDKNTLNKEHPELKAECLRVVNNLGSIEVPEWKNKNLEFAIPFRFALK